MLLGTHIWRRKWQHHITPIFLPGEFHGRGAWRAPVHGVAESDHHSLTHSLTQAAILL